MPDLELEETVSGEFGSSLIAGLDEAGRGAIAGPVVASAVILPLGVPSDLVRLADVDDSKKVSARERERLYDLIVEVAIAYGIGSAPSDEIDQYGIISATRLAMRRALALLDPQPHFLLIDGRIRLREPALPQQSVIRGDAKSLSIAAASILAKVTRDRVMREHQDSFPHYDFGRHKGYCTAAHVEALAAHGPCRIHRRSFAPLRQTLI